MNQGGTNERPLPSFQVITDTHVTIDPEHVHNRNLERALQDIAENGQDSIGIMHAGDVNNCILLPLIGEDIR